ncbi:MAG TPA: hypothetical protein GX708_02545 [Gallicola sp.]|nr:hypothetical protein [Gallicola sp.]
MEDKELYPEFRCDMCNQYQDNGCDLETGMCDKCSDTLRKTFYYKTMQQELSTANDKLKKIEEYIHGHKLFGMRYGKTLYRESLINILSIIEGND